MKQEVPLKKLSEYEHAIESCTNKKWYGGGNYINLSDQNAKNDEKTKNRRHTIPMYNMFCF